MTNKLLYTLPIVLALGAGTAFAQLGKDTEKEQRNPPNAPPQKSMQDQPSAKQSRSAKNGPEITSASAVASAKDDQKVRLRGKIVSQQSKNEYMFSDSSGQVLVEIGSTALKGSNKQLTSGTEVEIQGEVDTRKGKSPKVEAKTVNIVASASGSSGASSSPMRSSPSGSSSGSSSSGSTSR